MGTLFLVATPIGNLEDITQRALRILGEVALIAAEDTRVAGRMLQRFEIETRMLSYHGESRQPRVEEIMAMLATSDVAVISDAGMPGISDPGSELVRAAIERGYPIIPVPGASSVIAAAAASGAVDNGFVFGGFLPRSGGARIKKLRELCAPGLPVILFEAPTRIERLFGEIASELPDSQITVGREITKLYEEWLRGTPEEIAGKVNPRGEFVLVIEPRITRADPQSLLDDTLNEALEEGATLREAVDRAIAATGMSRKPVYARALEISKRG